jgi:hypothetical protein
MLPTQAWLTWRNNNAAQAFMFQKEKKTTEQRHVHAKKKGSTPELTITFIYKQPQLWCRTDTKCSIIYISVAF